MGLGVHLRQAAGVFWVEGRNVFLSGGGSKRKLFLHASGNQSVLY